MIATKEQVTLDDFWTEFENSGKGTLESILGERQGGKNSINILFSQMLTLWIQEEDTKRKRRVKPKDIFKKILILQEKTRKELQENNNAKLKKKERILGKMIFNILEVTGLALCEDNFPCDQLDALGIALNKIALQETMKNRTPIILSRAGNPINWKQTKYFYKKTLEGTYAS